MTWPAAATVKHADDCLIMQILPIDGMKSSHTNSRNLLQLAQLVISQSPQRGNAFLWSGCAFTHKVFSLA